MTCSQQTWGQLYFLYLPICTLAFFLFYDPGYCKKILVWPKLPGLRLFFYSFN